MQTLEACPPRQGPVVFAPCRESVASRSALLAGGAPHDAGHAVPLWGPAKRQAQTGDAPLLAWGKTADPAHRGGLWCHWAVKFCQPLGPHPHQPFRVLLQAAGTHPVIRLSAHQGCTPTGGLHHFLTPDVAGIGQLPVCEDGRARAPLGRPRLGMDARARHVHHTGLQPVAPQVEQDPIGAAHAPPVPAPGRGHRLAEALDSSRSQRALASVLAGAGEGADRLPRPPSAALAVTTSQQGLPGDGREPRRAGQWHQGVFPGGDA